MRYEIIEHAAGEGGFGQIDKALDTELDRIVAIKNLDPLFKDEPSTADIERFRREARTLAKLSHPSVPAIYDVRIDEEDKRFQIVFEWIDGITIRQYLRDKGLVSLEQARSWFTDTCSALRHAHDAGIVHRDIKPSNLIIGANNTCIVVDFGIALSETDLERITSGTRIGTPGYMSPEQEEGGEIDFRTDIFSLGVVLYECLAGQRPRIGEYHPLSEQNEAIPPAIDDLVKSCIRPVDARLDSISKFVDHLSDSLQPHSNFSETLSSGSLFEIQLALDSMSANAYCTLPVGQRVLILTRVQDLVDVDEFKLRNAVASLHAALVTTAHKCEPDIYRGIVEKSLFYGYDQEYGDTWIGNSQIRDGFNLVSLKCDETPHDIISVEAAQYFGNLDLKIKDGWYLHDLRELFQNLLTNPACNAANAEISGKLLREVNKAGRR